MIQPSKLGATVGFALSTYLDSVQNIQENSTLERLWMISGDPTVYGRKELRMSDEGKLRVT